MLQRACFFLRAGRMTADGKCTGRAKAVSPRRNRLAGARTHLASHARKDDCAQWHTRARRRIRPDNDVAGTHHSRRRVAGAQHRGGLTPPVRKRCGAAATAPRGTHRIARAPVPCSWASNALSPSFEAGGRRRGSTFQNARRVPGERYGLGHTPFPGDREQASGAHRGSASAVLEANGGFPWGGNRLTRFSGGRARSSRLLNTGCKAVSKARNTGSAGGITSSRSESPSSPRRSPPCAASALQALRGPVRPT